MSVDELYLHMKKAKDCNSLVKKHLTAEVFLNQKDKKTKYGGTLADCIRTGMHHSVTPGTGIRVPDPDAYSVFWDLLEPLILERHKVDVIDHPDQDLGDISNLPFSTLDDGNYVLSTRIRTGRSIKGYSFSTTISSRDRSTVEERIVGALSTLPEGLNGKYHPLSSLSEQERKELIKSHYLFSESQSKRDGATQEYGLYRDWPNNRGIFMNANKTFIAWVNEEDHLRIIVIEKGNNLGLVYTKFVQAVQCLEKSLPFERKDGLGYLNTCPSNLGTALRASVHIRIPRLSQQPDFQDILAKYRLEARGVDGVGTESIGGVYDISNHQRLGLSEIQAVSAMATGIRAIIEMEKKLQ